VSEPRGQARPRALVALAVLLFIEGAALTALALLLIFDAVSQQPDSYLSAVALIVLAVLAAAWLLVMGAHTLQARPWIRGGAATWQILQIIVGITAITGGQPLGWVLVVVAALVLVLLFTRSVVVATRRELPEE
jgi:hypothetical protein